MPSTRPISCRRSSATIRKSITTPSALLPGHADGQRGRARAAEGHARHGRRRRLLKAGGYGGEKVAMLVATDYVTFKALGDVAADMMGKAGMNVDYVVTDWGTMLQRRTNKGPVAQGGWSCFVTSWAGVDHSTPPATIALRGNGDEPGAWPGWCVSPKLERSATPGSRRPTSPAQQQICRDMQVQCDAGCAVLAARPVSASRPPTGAISAAYRRASRPSGTSGGAEAPPRAGPCLQTLASTPGPCLKARSLPPRKASRAAMPICARRHPAPRPRAETARGRSTHAAL